MKKSTGSEQRQHLTLSNEADLIIREDSVNFLGSENISGCINRIIRNSRETSPASISYVIENKREYYNKVLSTVQRREFNEECKIAVINELIKKDIQEFTSRLQTYPGEKSYKIRLQNDIWEDLYMTDNWREKDYYRSQGAYIKALIEDYASRSVYDREEIFFKDLLTRLQTAILLPKEEALILRIKYQTADSKTIACNIKPFKIVSDQARQYHYLVALSCPVNSADKTYNPASFRLSRIDETSIRDHAKSYGSGSISNVEKTRISKLLKEKGAQFLRDSEETIKIRLSRKGIELFESQYYMRPASSSIIDIKPLEDGSSVYSFKCTRRQIEYYFFKFGKEAVVIEPIEFSASLHNKYADAVKAYTESSTPKT